MEYQDLHSTNGPEFGIKFSLPHSPGKKNKTKHETYGGIQKYNQELSQICCLEEQICLHEKTGCSFMPSPLPASCLRSESEVPT